MLEGVTALNHQITELAPVLNSPTIADAVTVAAENQSVPLATMVKRQGGGTYLFAVGMREGATAASFTLKGLEGDTKVEVLGENRTLTARNGAFKDQFGSWDVHLYRMSR
jgi:hypothetical protein